MPPLVLTVRPAGPDTNAKEREFAGRSESVAAAAADQGTDTGIVWFVGVVSIGAEFTSLTVSVKVLVALKTGVPLSYPRTVTG